MKNNTESFFVYTLVIVFIGLGFLPLAAYAGVQCSLLTVLAVSPISFYAAAQLYMLEEKRERARRRKATRLHIAHSTADKPLRAA